jgi:hypothetical protein
VLQAHNKKVITNLKMSLYTRKEFAAVCQTTAAVVTTNINRGKIVLFDKKIDSENPINKAFFDRYYNKHEAKVKKQKVKATQVKEIDELYNSVVETKVKTIKQKKKEAKTDKRRKEANKEAEIIVDWDLRKKKAETLLKERQAEKEKMQLEKLAGKLLPTDLIFNIVRIHNTSIFATFQNDIENQASIFCDILAGGDRKMLAKLNDKLSGLLSAAVKNAEDVAEQSIKNAVAEYAQTRNRGERK